MFYLTRTKYVYNTIKYRALSKKWLELIIQNQLISLIFKMSKILNYVMAKGT